MACSSVAKPENRNDINAIKKKDSCSFFQMSFLFPLIATISMPSLALKKASSDILLFYTFMCRHWREKNATHWVLISWKWQRKGFQCLSCVAMRPHKGQMWIRKSGEIRPVETNAIVQHFGKMATCYAGLWSPIAKKDEVKEEKVQQGASRRIMVHKVYYKKSLTVGTHFSSCSYSRNKVNCSGCCSPPEPAAPIVLLL